MLMANNVNHPSHYNNGKYECIEVMKEVFGENAVKDFCRLNAFKYLWRANNKNGDEDIQKAIWYLNELTKENNMPPEKSNKDVKFGFVNEDGEFVEIPFLTSFEGTFEVDKADDDESEEKSMTNADSIANIVWGQYESFMSVGFNDYQSFELTRIWFGEMIKGAINVEEN